MIMPGELSDLRVMKKDVAGAPTKELVESSASSGYRTRVFMGSLLDKEAIKDLRASIEARERSKNYDRMVIGCNVPQVD
jgi:hypothetical protein